MSTEERRNCLQLLRDDIRTFVKERGWEEKETPKNLATALCVEAGELLEPFIWLRCGNVEELGREHLCAVRNEMADVLIYLIALADGLETDLVDAVRQKMELNRVKHPPLATAALTRRDRD